MHEEQKQEDAEEDNLRTGMEVSIFLFLIQKIMRKMTIYFMMNIFFLEFLIPKFKKKL